MKMYKGTTGLIILLSIVFSAKSQSEIAATNPGQGTSHNNGGISAVYQANMVKHRVVIQISSGDTLAWTGLMHNIEHLKTGWGDSVLVEVVAHGPAIDLLVTAKTTQQKKIAEFKKMGVVFVACENSLKARNIPKEAVIPEAGFVPMGVGEIIMKQEQGWSYLKAGF
jgi:uncharacterized protein